MESKVMTITPELAAEMLERNMPTNRPIFKSTVHAYARLMKSGKWNLTHQGIAFDENGMLIDGQHRLKAVIEANIPVQMNVTFDVRHAPGEMFSIDMGRKRTYANITSMSGIYDPVYKYMGMYVNAYLRYKGQKGHNSEPAETVDYIERHYQDVAMLCDLIGASYHGNARGSDNRRLPGIVGAALLAAMYRGEDKEAIRRFSEVYRRNEVSGCEGYNPKYALNLRDYVSQYKHNADVYNRCESSIWAFAHNLSALRVRDNCYPFNQALDA